MKIVIFVVATFGLLLLGGFVYLIFADVPVQQTEITKELPHDTFAQ